MDDTISRQAAIELIHKVMFEFFDLAEDDEESPITEKDKMVLEINKKISTSIKSLPTVDVPDRKVGEWIDEPVYRQTMDGKTWDGFTYCSECKQLHEYGYRSKFCPNCGAEMKGESDD